MHLAFVLFLGCQAQWKPFVLELFAGKVRLMKDKDIFDVQVSLDTWRENLLMCTTHTHITYIIHCIYTYISFQAFSKKHGLQSKLRYCQRMLLRSLWVWRMYQNLVLIGRRTGITRGSNKQVPLLNCQVSRVPPIPDPVRLGMKIWSGIR